MRVPPVRLAAVLVAGLLAGAAAGCGPAASPTPRPELAWSRADIALPADVSELAPGSSGGMICSPCHAVQASLLLGIAATEQGLLAVGVQQPPSGAVAYRSADGRTWTPEPGFAPDGATGEETGDETSALAAAGDDGRVVVVGTRGAGAGAWARDRDAAGATVWRTAPDQPSLHGETGGTTVMRAVVAWKGGFVAVGSADADASTHTAAAWTSPDGLAWERVGVEGSTFEDAAAYGIAASADRLVIVGARSDEAGGSGVAWISTDGVTWTRSDSQALADGPMRAVTATSSAFVAVGFSAADDRAVAWLTPDGVAWEAVTSSPGLQNRGDAIRMASVAATADGLVAAGWKSDAGNGSGVIWTSADGRTWVRLPDQVSMSGASLGGVAVIDGRPVVAGTSGYPDNDQASAWFEGP